MRITIDDDTTKKFDDNGMSMSLDIHIKETNISFFFLLEKNNENNKNNNNYITILIKQKFVCFY